MAFYVGQKVVCVKRDVRAPNWAPDATMPRYGEVYTIRAIDVYPRKTLLRLNEIVNQNYGFPLEGGFWSIFFRPLVEQKGDISIFKSMLNHASHKQLEGV
jgi:hypothetical protein